MKLLNSFAISVTHFPKALNCMFVEILHLSMGILISLRNSLINLYIFRVEAIKKHHFFDGVDWSQVAAQKVMSFKYRSFCCHIVLPDAIPLPLSYL